MAVVRVTEREANCAFAAGCWVGIRPIKSKAKVSIAASRFTRASLIGSKKGTKVSSPCLPIITCSNAWWTCTNVVRACTTNCASSSESGPVDTESTLVVPSAIFAMMVVNPSAIMNPCWPALKMVMVWTAIRRLLDCVVTLSNPSRIFTVTGSGSARATNGVL